MREEQCWGRVIWHEELSRQPLPVAHMLQKRQGYFVLTRTSNVEAEFENPKYAMTIRRL